MDGNLTNDGHFAYTWDAENRLTSVISNGTVIASFKYDYMSRRYEKATAAGTNTFLWDGWLPVCELSNPTTGNSATNFYVWGLDLSGSLQGAGGIGGLLTQVQGTNVLMDFCDGNGNISEVYRISDSAPPEQVAHFEYSPFGELTASTISPNLHIPCRFSSKYLDGETGLYYFGFRYLRPELAWISRDPMGEMGGENMYAASCNDPMDMVDGFGLWYMDGNFAVAESKEDTLFSLARILGISWSSLIFESASLEVTPCCTKVDVGKWVEPLRESVLTYYRIGVSKIYLRRMKAAFQSAMADSVDWRGRLNQRKFIARLRAKVEELSPERQEVSSVGLLSDTMSLLFEGAEAATGGGGRAVFLTIGPEVKELHYRAPPDLGCLCSLRGARSTPHSADSPPGV